MSLLLCDYKQGWAVVSPSFLAFSSKIFHSKDVDSFHKSVRELLLDELAGLDHGALLATKSLIKKGLQDKNDIDAVNSMRESYGMYYV